MYLWSTLVLPIALYGLEVLTLCEADIEKFKKIESGAEPPTRVNQENMQKQTLMIPRCLVDNLPT